MRFLIVFTLLAFLFLPATEVLAQLNARLKFVKELPRDLFTNRTALIITVVSTDASTDVAKKYAELAQKFKADNQQLGFNLVQVVNGETLNSRNGMLEQSNKLNQLAIAQLFMLDYVNIAGTGSRENYKLVITDYNKNSNFVTENQRAFSLQAESYDHLLSMILENINSYPNAFFDKSDKPNAGNSDIVLKTEEKEDVIGDHRTPPEVRSLPQIYIAAEDMERSLGGTQRNFYYSVQGETQNKNAGYFGQRLRKDVKLNATALEYLNRYRTDKWAYLAGWTVITGSVVGYASQVYQDIGTSYFNDKQKVFAATAVLATLSNILVTKNTNLHFKKAVDEYNLFALSGGKTGSLRLKPSGLQFGALQVPNSHHLAPALQLTWKIRP